MIRSRNHSFDVPDNLWALSDDELREHASLWASQSETAALTADERIDLAIRIRVFLRQMAPGVAAADARFAKWGAAFGVSVADVDVAIDRWTRRANSC